jgi:hypothetical protein
LYLSDQDAKSISSDYHRFSFPVNIQFANPNQVQIALEHVYFTNSNPTVHAYNNKLYFTESVAGALTATLNAGVYDSTTILTEVKRALDAASGLGPYTVTYDATTTLISVTPDSGTVSFQDGSNSAHYLLGFDPDTATNSPYVGTDFLNLAGSSSVQIRSSLPAYGYHSIGGGSVLAEIPLTSPFGFQETHVVEHLFWQPMDVFNGLLEIELLDDRNQPFVMSTNSNVRFKFRLRLSQ